MTGNGMRMFSAGSEETGMKKTKERTIKNKNIYLNLKTLQVF
jgi:hypothetical protein